MEVGEYYGAPDLVVKILRMYEGKCDFEIIEIHGKSNNWKVGSCIKDFHQRSISNSLKLLKGYNTPLWKVLNGD